jgi:hypothetical protein
MLALGGIGLAGGVAALASGRWYLECRDSTGYRMGGIDCLGSTPRTHNAPAEWLGFYGWAAVCVVCAIAVALAFIRLRRARRTA